MPGYLSALFFGVQKFKKSVVYISKIKRKEIAFLSFTGDKKGLSISFWSTDLSWAALLGTPVSIWHLTVLVIILDISLAGLYSPRGLKLGVWPSNLGGKSLKQVFLSENIILPFTHRRGDTALNFSDAVRSVPGIALPHDHYHRL